MKQVSGVPSFISNTEIFFQIKYRYRLSDEWSSACALRSVTRRLSKKRLNCTITISAAGSHGVLKQRSAAGSSETDSSVQQCGDWVHVHVHVHVHVPCCGLWMWVSERSDIEKARGGDNERKQRASPAPHPTNFVVTRHLVKIYARCFVCTFTRDTCFAHKPRDVSNDLINPRYAEARSLRSVRPPACASCGAGAVSSASCGSSRADGGPCRPSCPPPRPPRDPGAAAG